MAKGCLNKTQPLSGFEMVPGKVCAPLYNVLFWVSCTAVCLESSAFLCLFSEKKVTWGTWAPSPRTWLLCSAAVNPLLWLLEYPFLCLCMHICFGTLFSALCFAFTISWLAARQYSWMCCQHVKMGVGLKHTILLFPFFPLGVILLGVHRLPSDGAIMLLFPECVKELWKAPKGSITKNKVFNS